MKDGKKKMDKLKKILSDWSSSKDIEILEIQHALLANLKRYSDLSCSYQKEGNLNNLVLNVIKYIDDNFDISNFIYDRSIPLTYFDKIREFPIKDTKGKRYLFLEISSINIFLILNNPTLLISSPDKNMLIFKQTPLILDVSFEGRSLNKKIFINEPYLYKLNVSKKSFEITSNLFTNASMVERLLVNEEIELEDLIKHGYKIDLYDEILPFYNPSGYINYDEKERKTSGYIKDLREEQLDLLYFCRKMNSNKLLNQLLLRTDSKKVYFNNVVEGKAELPFVRTFIKMNKILGQEDISCESVYLAHLLTTDGPEEEWPIKYKEYFKRIREEFSK